MNHKAKSHLILTPLGAFGIAKLTDHQSSNSLLNYINGKLPMTLSYGYDKLVLERVIADKNIVMSSGANKAISAAVKGNKEPDYPILEPTDYELTGYVDNGHKLTAKVTSTKLGITKGNQYEVMRLSAEFDSYYSKPKMRLTMSGSTEVYENDYKLHGCNYGLGFHNDSHQWKTFIDNRDGRGSLKYLWTYFEKPKVKTIDKAYPEKYKDALNTIEFAEILNNFDCFSGQKEYIAKVSLTDSACITAETGCGKTFFAINLDLIKNCKKTLLIAPKGTVKSSDVAAQWMKEFKRFSPDRQVFQLFNIKDYKRLIYEYGELPDGVYFTYHTAYFNGGFEDFPTSWPADERGSKFDHKFDHITYDDHVRFRVESGFHHGIGMTRRGITCVYKPHLSTIIGNIFDMIIIDEAHLMCNLNSLVTRAVLKLQARYKYCMTATPIPNICHNIFPLMGWLAVPNWYQGGIANSRWPFTRENISQFKDLYLSKELDFTKYRNGENTRPRDAARISNTPKLLMKLKSIVAYISKQDCNPDLVDCKINTIRVPFGSEQKKLYSYNLDLENIPYDSFARAGVQQQRLRGLCADPHGRDWLHDSDKAPSMNPKMLATMRQINHLVSEGEQVVHIAAFKGQNDSIAKLLAEADIPYSRIDSSVSNHAKQSDNFKEGRTKVMLMGIKCAVGHSFDNCRHLIIGSLEWSYGTFNQALGRIYRLNSPRDVECTIFLVKDSIEELMFDRLAQKEDSATICTKGQRVPTNYVNESDSEIFALHLKQSLAGKWSPEGIDESKCEQEWFDIVT